MWEINSLSQVTFFLWAMLLGGIYCFFYDMLRAYRKNIHPSAVAVFAQDIFYSVLCAFVCFCFLLAATGGELRAYIFCGIAAGFAVFRLTLSRFFTFIFSKIICLLRAIFRFFRAVFRRITVFSANIIDCVQKKMNFFFRFVADTSKKGLKKK